MEATESLLDARHQSGPWRTKVRRRLLSWYRKNQRDLPWRKNPDPYRVWISEIMLQQTQVATVIPYYERFLERFPDVGELAKASEADVLKLWEGLGYYRRARQMHAAAIEIVKSHGGAFPIDFDSVLALPGIGRYTAGAILSISTGKRYPVVEANTLRLYARLIGLEQSPTSAAAQRLLWKTAEDLLPRKDCGQFNQAAMELGSLVCTPKNPPCPECPLAGLCTAFDHGQQEQIPGKIKKLKYESIDEVALVLQSRRDEVLMRRCQPGERWAGLWDFPRTAVREDSDRESTLRELAENLRAGASQPDPWMELKHAVTKYRITLSVYQFTITRKTKPAEPYRWVSTQELEELPLSTTGRKIAQKLTDSC